MGGEKLRFPALLARELGSPPRGRGKGGVIRYTNFTHRITPAWAGKSIPVNEIDGMKKDHPRVGGEKGWSCPHRWPATGSPPRGRGKGGPQGPGLGPHRITPAWAGKSLGFRWCCYVCWDHPRVGGEKFLGPLDVLPHGGSPPRGRGKELPFVGFEPHTGITPAWAGKSTSGGSVLLTAADHPRVGGEKTNRQELRAKRPGSPPRGRGKGLVICSLVRTPRITPAWAGKRKCPRPPAGGREDHPRVGGEKRVRPEVLPSGQGSPPRGRGKGPPGSGSGKQRGITPAWAGKSEEMPLLPHSF